MPTQKDSKITSGVRESGVIETVTSEEVIIEGEQNAVESSVIAAQGAIIESEHEESETDGDVYDPVVNEGSVLEGEKAPVDPVDEDKKRPPKWPPISFDDHPDIISVDAGQVDETDIVDDGVDSVTGQIVVDYGIDGPGTIVANGNVPTNLTSGGEAVTVALDLDGNYVGTTANGDVIFKLELNTDGSYVFNLTGTLDHPDASDDNDALILNFGFTATDNDGDSVSGVIPVKVLDDGPTAVDDDGGILATATTYRIGNVITNDDPGADGFDSSPVVSVYVDVSNVMNITPGGSITIDGTYGTLQIFSDGWYQYTLNTGGVNATDVFYYTITDADGDASTAQLTFTIDIDCGCDDEPIIITPDIQVVDETDMNPTDVVSGTIDVDFQDDGPGTLDGDGTFSFGGSVANNALTSCGEPVLVTLDADGNYVGATANGDLIFTLKIEDDGTYTFTLIGTLDHAEQTDLYGNPGTDDVINLFFGVVATDADGDTATTTIQINVHDDAPQIWGNWGAVYEADLVNGPIIVSDTLNAEFGADGPGEVGTTGLFTVLFDPNGTPQTLTSGGEVVNVTWDDTSYTGTLADGTVVFTLVIDPATGDHTYTQYVQIDHPNTGDPNDVIWLKFGIDITDCDGDKDRGIIIIDLVDDGPSITSDIQTVDETDLGPDGIDSVSGQVVGSFGGDGPGSIVANGNVPTGLTSCGEDVTVTINADGNYVGTTTSGDVIFTLTINADGSFTFDLTGVLDHPDTTDHDDVITLTFGVDAVDADGDTASGTIQINVHDDGPSLHTHPTLFSTGVDEDDLANGGQIFISRTAAEFSGYHSFGEDGPGAITTNGDFIAAFQMGGQNQPLTSGGELITVTSNGNSYTGTLANGTVVFIFTIDPATGAHTYTQNLPIDHPDTNDHDDIIWLKFGIQIEDCDGDTDTSYIIIDLHDSGPTAVDDDVHADCDVNITTGNVITNDEAGGDGFDDSPVVSINLDGSPDVLAVPAGGSTIINGLYGDLEIFSDGSYTYTLTGNNSTWIDVNIDNFNWGLQQNGYNLPLNIDIQTNGQLDHIVVDLVGAFGNNPDITLSAGVEISPGVWEVQAADIPGLQIQLPNTGDPVYDVTQLGGQWGNNVIEVTAYTTDIGVDVFNYTITDADGDSSTAQLSFEVCGASDTDDATIGLFYSPLIFDLDGDGVEHVYYEDHDIFFDLNADGVTDHTGWVGADDGFLALDHNGNGLIDNGSELFGTATIDGFTVLAQYDSNADGIIDAQDDVWSDLIIWQDSNMDGISQQSEMIGLDELGIVSINLNAVEVDEFDNGNFVSDASDFTWADGSTGVVEDVWFAYQNGAGANVNADAETQVVSEDVVEGLYSDCTILEGCTFDADDADTAVSSERLDLLSVLDSAADVLQDSINDFLDATKTDVDSIATVCSGIDHGTACAKAGIDISMDLTDLLHADTSTVI